MKSLKLLLALAAGPVLTARAQTAPASRAQADQQLRGVLSPDQYARYQQLLALPDD